MDWSGHDFDSSLEIFFLNFYHQIIKDENLPNSVSANTDSLRKIKEAFRTKVGLSDIHFDSAEARCAYVFQYGTLFSSAVASHFMNMLEQNPVILDRLLAQNTVVICCLGGGPGTELLAIAKIMHHMMAWYPFGGQRLRKIHAFVVDIDPGWYTTAVHVVRNLSKSFASQFDLTFIPSDLSKPITGELQSVLENAHIVTAVKFISAIYNTKGGFKTELMLQRIANFMSGGSLLFFLDSFVPKYFRVLVDAMTSFRSMVEIYGPFASSVHTLFPGTVGRSLRLFSGSYGSQRLARITKNYVSSWCKRSYSNTTFQTPAGSASVWTTHWMTNQWNQSHFNYQASDTRVENCVVSSNNNYHPNSALEVKRKTAAKRRQIRDSENYDWNFMNKTDSRPPRKKRRYF